MQKDVAGQTWTVFAFDRTDNTAKTGDSANITAKISKDGAAGADLADAHPVELEAGYYEFDLSRTETNYDKLTIIPVSSTADIQVVGDPGAIHTSPAGFPDDVMVGTEGAAIAGDEMTLTTGAIDSIWDEAMTELAAMPGATASLRDALTIIFMALRNKQTTTASAQTISNNSGATIATSVVSDDATTFTKNEYA